MLVPGQPNPTYPVAYEEASAAVVATQIILNSRALLAEGEVIFVVQLPQDELESG